MPAHLLLMFGVLPLWLAAGALDWALHRNSSIETTSGTRESVLHLLMLAELGLPVLAVLWLEVDAAVLALCAAGFVLHELTVYTDLKWSVARRNISPLEQMVHSAQEMLPLVGLALLAVAHWDEVLALVGVGTSPAAYALKPKAVPLPAPYVAAAMAGSAVVALLYVEELIRCLRARR
ncbi:diguanylate cyclase [Variovorax sp. DT-64]|uniref:diguanylate cyclase n=1 Tax=Variovorax sp. DT-64 TaxID=3396160 RepID=UPI003F1A439D